jgi:hypothetical protein
VRANSWYPCLTASLMALACDTPGVTLIDPGLNAPPDSVTFVVRLEDSTLAAALGWSDGVPGADVILNRVGDEFNPAVLRTDATGRVRLHNPAPGVNRIAAYRVLSEDETGSTGGLRRAFGDGRKTTVGRTGQLELSAGEDRAGSLVFSEIYAIDQQYASMYQWFQYFELYNNSDTTVYADGMIWGRGWHLDREYPPYPCATTEAIRNDPLGLWAIFFHRFPGSGGDFPVAPGETVVVAMDAVDHSVVHPAFPDLSSADFELLGSGDVDNPDVPNVVEIGLRPWFRSHGLDMTWRDVLFLALPSDIESLHRAHEPITGDDWVRFPTESLLDVVTLAPQNIAAVDQLATPCAVSVNRQFDRLEGGFISTWNDTTIALHRRIVRTSTNGRNTLQDLNTSFLDLVIGKRSPGRIEY